MPTLRELRESKCLSLRDLAKLSGVSVSTINRLELGKQRANFKTRRALAKELGIKPGQLSYFLRP